MGRVKTFANGGSFAPVDMDMIEADAELLFSTWKSVGPTQCGTINSTTGAPCLLPADGFAAKVIGPGGVSIAFGQIFTIPQVPAINRRSLRMRMSAEAYSAGVPGASLTVALRQVTLLPGNAGSVQRVASMSDPILGSQIVFPLNFAFGTQYTTDFSYPSQSLIYAISVQTDVIVTAGTTIYVRTKLQYRAT